MPGATASSRRATATSRINVLVADGAACRAKARASGSIQRYTRLYADGWLVE